ncbi:hypothetical protein ScPMuIL_017443 [Solemya velum]
MNILSTQNLHNIITVPLEKLHPVATCQPDLYGCFTDNMAKLFIAIAMYVAIVETSDEKIGKTYEICTDEDIRTADGYLKSPNHPKRYPKNIECRTEITVSKGYKIRIVFQKFDVHTPTSACFDDFIELSDRYGLQSPLRLCGMKHKNEIWTSVSNSAGILFKTNHHYSHSGFFLKFTAVLSNIENDYYDGCYGTLNSSQGQIISRNYPENYYNHETCYVAIHAPDKKHIRFRFLDFSLEDSGYGCPADYIQFVDLVTGNYTVRMCGNHHNGRVWQTNSNKAAVIFSSDFRTSSSGFKLNFTTVNPGDTGYFDGCNGFLQNETGLIMSPNFPDHYSPNELCSIAIRVGEGRMVRLHFETFQLHHSNEACHGDFLQITDENTEKTTGKLCGDQPEGQIWISDSNDVYLIFKTDYIFEDTGFKISYRGIHPNESEYYDGCNGVLKTNEGVVTSRRFPDPYFNNEKCETVIYVPENQRIIFKFVSFELQDTPDCASDYMKLTDLQTGKTTNKLCARRQQGLFWLSDSNSVKVDFQSDYESVNRGYNVSFMATNNTEFYDGCFGDITEENGKLTSRNDHGLYFDNEHCEINLTVPEGKLVLVNFSYFQLEDSIGCKSDFLQITDMGGTKSSKIFCGRIPESRIWVSETNQIKVVFHTNSNQNYKGFELNFKNISAGEIDYFDGCNGVIRSRTGNIVSAHYPRYYISNDICNISIVVPEGMKILFNYTYQIEESNSLCAADYLQLTDKVSGKTTGPMCGYERSWRIWFSETNRVILVFKTDHRNEERGFNISFKEISPNETDFYDGCNGHIYGTHGVIYSPNYPCTYPPNQNCAVVITVPEDMIIQFHFTEFYLQDSGYMCPGDYLQLVDLCLENTRSRKLCGSDFTGRTLYSKCNSVQLVFKTDYYLSDDGFKLEYLASPISNQEASDGCNAIFNSSDGLISSRGYPWQYPNNQFCNTTVIVFRGQVVRFTIEDIYLQVTDMCTADSVRLVDPLSGKSSDAMCGDKHIGRIWQSDHHIAHVYFRSDYAHAYRGYNITFEAVMAADDQYFDTCNGHSYNNSGNITSPGFSTHYNSEEHCQLIITVDKEKRIMITIDEFHMEHCTECGCDYLQFEDKISRRKSQKFCGSQLKDTIWVSDSYHVSVVFVTDSFNNYRGYRLHWEDIDGETGHYDGCNGVIHTDNNGSGIKSLNFPKTYRNNEHCVVRIEGPKHSIFNLTFGSIMLGDSGAECLKDFILFTDLISGKVSKPYCGRRHNGSTWFSDSNKILIVFRTDEKTQERGFSLAYKVELGYLDYFDGCDGYITADEVTITSPNWPDQYIGHDRCKVNIMSSEQSKVLLNFTSFDLVGNSSSIVCLDYLQIVDLGSSRTSPRFCNPIPSGRLWLSDTNNVTIEFRSQGSPTSFGYRLEYRSVNESYVLPLNMTIPDEVILDPSVGDCPCNMFLQQICMCCLAEKHPYGAMEIMNRYYNAMTRTIY